jgi:hypothetical protein
MTVTPGVAAAGIVVKIKPKLLERSEMGGTGRDRFGTGRNRFGTGRAGLAQRHNSQSQEQGPGYHCFHSSFR